MVEQNLAERLSMTEASIFKGVDPQALQPLIDKMESIVYQEGDVIFDMGDEGEAMYLVVTGRIRVFLPDEIGEDFITLRYYHPTQTVGELSLIDARPRSAAAAAAVAEDAAPDTSILVYKLNRADFAAFLEASPAVGLAMMRDLTSRVRYTTQFLERLMDSINWMLDGDYERALQEVAISTTDDEIQNLIATCLKMIRKVQDRAQAS